MFRMVVGFLGLAVCLFFPGNGNADVVFSESFEGATNQFAQTSNNYNALYTTGWTNSGPTGSGSKFFYGGPGGAGTTSFTTANFNILTSTLTSAKIDAGLGQYSFSSWFSRYYGDPDYATLQLQFKNSSGNNVGSLITIGGVNFIPTITNNKYNWNQDLNSGAIPVGATQAAMTILSTGAAGGDRDGYADLVSLDVVAVPEPGTLLLGGIAAACGGGGVWWKRRKRDFRKIPDPARETVSG